MSIKTLMATTCAGLLCAVATSGLAQDTDKTEGTPTRSCCMSACAGHHAENRANGKMRCSLTGKVMGTCCCVEKEGRMHCTLAGKDVESCCCAPVADQTDTTGPSGENDTNDKADTIDDTSQPQE